MPHMRKKYIAGNWKMHKTVPEAVAFFEELIEMVGGVKETQMYLAVPFTAIAQSCAAADGSSVVIGAQNMSEFPSGAYTGEISADMLKDAGVEFVLIGHSERRCHYHEDHPRLQAKLKQAILEEIQPIFCIGELEEEREKGQTQKVLESQLGDGLKGLEESQLSTLVIAYEPIWAIGTGKTATPEMAEEAHKMCRGFLAKLYSEEFAKNISILYGGSVKPDNIDKLMQQENIDGALVGGASLDADSFNKLIHYSRN